jgi:radical SAM protein with 4Fe4S-binding SPASM domain
MFKELRIEVNKACNLACDHCYTEKKGPPGVEIEQFKNIIREAAEKGATDLSLTGGEPLIDKPRTYAMIQAGVEAGLTVRLNTNGILVTEAISAELKSSGVTEVQISLNSADEDDFDIFVHRKGAFKKVKAAIEHLKKDGIETTIRYTLMKRNMHQLVPTYRLITEWQVDAFKVRCLVQTNHIKEDGWAEAAGELRAALTDLVAASHDGPTRVFIADDGLKAMEHKTGKCDKLVCKCGKDAIFISSDGNISPCPFLRETSEFHLGNIRQDDVFDVYFNSGKLKAFIGAKDTHASGGNEMVDNCKASVLSASVINF